MINYDFCVSSYLAFRYVAHDNVSWKEGVMPAFPIVEKRGRLKVKTAADVLKNLRKAIHEVDNTQGLGVLLSSGMDSAIIAALLPPGTRAYTVRFVAEDAIDEVPAAAKMAKRLGLNHTIVDVTWDDCDNCLDLLMKQKKAPLHPVEVGLYKAAVTAHRDGIDLLAVGNVADSTFGGFDKLLSKDWTFDEFVERYTFLDPNRALKRPTSVIDIFEPYRQENGFNVMGFLKVVHGFGIIQMFENAIHTGGCLQVAPFEDLVLDVPLDLKRIRNGEPKYILTEVFRTLFPGLDVPDKIPFARPVTQWLGNWQGPKRMEFLENLSMVDFSGEQKWQLYCLERFLDLLEKGGI